MITPRLLCPQSGHARRLAVGLLAARLLWSVPIQAAAPSYQPKVQVTDTLRTWGSIDMAGLLKGWEEGFRKFHPEVRFADTLKGTETAQAALYAEVADFALMDREIVTLERHVILRRKHTYPLAIAVATGSPDRADRAPALVVYVHKDNPLAKLSLAQLDGIFGEQRTGAWDDQFRWHPERARGPEKNIRTWGQVGLTGEWADKPIQTYGYPITNYSPRPGEMLLFRARTFGGGDMWNPNLREFDGGARITAALAQDRYGIAYASMPDRTDVVRPVPLVSGVSDDALLPTKDSVGNRSYPLTRPVYISVEPSRLSDPRVLEFLQYVLSREGQEVVAREGGYLPLTAAEAQVQRQKLTATTPVTK